MTDLAAMSDAQIGAMIQRLEMYTPGSGSFTTKDGSTFTERELTAEAARRLSAPSADERQELGHTINEWKLRNGSIIAYDDIAEIIDELIAAGWSKRLAAKGDANG